MQRRVRGRALLFLPASSYRRPKVGAYLRPQWPVVEVNHYPRRFGDSGSEAHPPGLASPGRARRWFCGAVHLDPRVESWQVRCSQASALGSAARE